MTTTAKLQDALAILAGAYLVLLQTNLALALRSVVAGLIVLVALALVLRPDARREAALSRPARIWVALFLASGAWSALSIGWSLRPRYSAGELAGDVAAMSAVALAMLFALRETVTFRRVVTATLAAFAVLALAAIVFEVAPAAWPFRPLHHAVGAWSTQVVLVAPMIALMRAPPDAGWGRGPAATSAAIALAALVLAAARITDNRMIWPALAVTLVALAAAGAWRWPERWRQRPARRALAFVAVAGVLVAAFVDVAQQKADTSLSPPATIERSVASDPRLAIWPRVGEAIAERPWTGHGYGREIRATELVRSLGDPTWTHAHNVFASVWLQTGAVGLALFVLLLGATVARFAGYLGSRDDGLALVGAVGIALVAGMLAKSLTDDFFARTNLRFFWTTVVLLIAFGERRLRMAPGNERRAG
jgi:O-antigen ligase